MATVLLLSAIPSVQSEYTVIGNNNGDLKMSKMTERARTYRLPNPSTPEDLECRWSKTMRFGDKVIVAGYYYNGPGKPSYFGAVYEFLTVDTGCEAEIALWEVSGLEWMKAMPLNGQLKMPNNHGA